MKKVDIDFVYAVFVSVRVCVCVQGCELDWLTVPAWVQDYSVTLDESSQWIRSSFKNMFVLKLAAKSLSLANKKSKNDLERKFLIFQVGMINPLMPKRYFVPLCDL